MNLTLAAILIVAAFAVRALMPSKPTLYLKKGGKYVKRDGKK